MGIYLHRERQLEGPASSVQQLGPPPWKPLSTPNRALETAVSGSPSRATDFQILLLKHA